MKKTEDGWYYRAPRQMRKVRRLLGYFLSQKRLSFFLEYYLSRQTKEFYTWQKSIKLSKYLYKQPHDSWRPDASTWSFQDIMPLLFHSGPSNRGICLLDFDEALTLWKLSQLCAHESCLEIGRFKGGGTVLIASALGTGGKLYSIDLESDYDKELTDALKIFGLNEKVELIVGDSGKVIIPNKNLLGLIFIDGDHSYEGVKRDIANWYPHLKPEGYMCFHDAVHTRFNDFGQHSVNKAVMDALSSPDYSLSTWCKVGSFIALRKA